MGRLLIAAGLCAVISVVGWIPLGMPSFALGMMMSDPTLGNICSGLGTTSGAAATCAGLVGIGAVLLGPLVTGIVVYVFRRQLARMLRTVLTLGGRVKSDFVAPVVATAVFMVVWASTHATAPMQLGFGLVPHLLFPVVVGTFTYWTVANGPALRTRCPAYFRLRDAVPRGLRGLIVAVVTTGFAIAAAPALADGANGLSPTHPQVVALVGLVLGYLLLVPEGRTAPATVPR